MNNFKLISSSSELPVSLTGFKEHIGFTGDSKNDSFELMIRAAADEAERYTGRQLMPAIFELQLSDFPSEVEIEKAPITGINSVKYFNASNEETTLVSGTDYYFDVVAEPARVVFINTYTVYQYRTDAININFGAGYSAEANIPALIRAAILFTAADHYVNPTDAVRNLPTKSKSLLRNYRLFNKE